MITILKRPPHHIESYQTAGYKDNRVESNIVSHKIQFYTYNKIDDIELLMAIRV